MIEHCVTVLTRKYAAVPVFVLSALVIALRCSWATPETPPFGVYSGAAFSPTVTVLESNADRIRLHLEMEHLPSDSFRVDFRRDTLLPLRGVEGLWGELNMVGALTPRLTLYLALPPQGNPAATIESWNTTAYPAVPATLADSTHEDSVLLGHVGIMGGVRLLPLTIFPIAYRNRDDTCMVMTEAEIRIDFDNEPGENPVADPPRAFSRTWQRVFQNLVTNWQYIPHIFTTAPSHLALIVPDQGSENYLPAVQNFIRWKRQRGMVVTVIPKSTIANLSAQQVRNRIFAELASSEPRIDHLLLVGDETKLPVQMLYTPDPTSRFNTFSYAGSYTDESYFAAVEGNDVFPDVFLGRWVVNLSGEVHMVAGRSVWHERTPASHDSLRFLRAMMAADYTVRTQRETKRAVRTLCLNYGFTQVDTLWGVLAQPQPLIDRVNSGVAFVNYRGQGWSYGWVGIGFYVTHITEINNPFRLPIVTGMGCGGAIFNNADNQGFGELWMLAGTISQPKGAVAFIGPCWNTHTVFNDCLDSLLYRAWFQGEVLSTGAALATAKMMLWAVIAPFQADERVEEVTKTMMRQYILLGDPSLMVYTQSPLQLQVIVPERVPRAPSQVEVVIENALDVVADSLCVTVWQNDTTALTRWLPRGSSSITLPVEPVADADTIWLTITGDNTRAFQRPLLVASNVEKASPPLPLQFELEPNAPNPFNQQTHFAFTLPQASRASLVIYDLNSRHVKTLVEGALPAGRHRASWDGRAENGLPVASGVYFCRLAASGNAATRKLVLLK